MKNTKAFSQDIRITWGKLLSFYLTCLFLPHFPHYKLSISMSTFVYQSTYYVPSHVLVTETVTVNRILKTSFHGIFIITWEEKKVNVQ